MRDKRFMTVADSDSQVYTVPIVSAIAVVLGTLIPTLFVCILQRQQMIQYIRGRLLRCRAQNDRSERKPLNPRTNQEYELQAIPTPAHRCMTQDTDLQRLASGEGNLEAIKQILVAGRADVNSGDRGGKTPVMVAAESGHRKMVEFLVGERADVSQVDTNGNNTLHLACQGGDVGTVKFVLSQKTVDVNSRGESMATPVMKAALHGHREVVELLVGQGADVSLAQGAGNTLHFACQGGDVDTVKFVLSLNKVDLNARDNYGRTASQVAKDYRHEQVVHLLETRGVTSV